MNTEQNQEEIVTPETNEGESETSAEIETIAIPKSEWEKTNQTIGSLKRELKDLRKPKEEPKETPQQTKQEDKQTSELDDVAKEILEIKGFTDEEDHTFIEKYMNKWGKTFRETLKDEELVQQLRDRKLDRETRAAIPSSTKRPGTPMGDTLELDLARYERDGTLPQNFERRSAVINAKIEKENPNKPSWRR